MGKKSHGPRMPWVPLYIDPWLDGSTRSELKHDERAIFSDFLCLAAKNGGYIGANVEAGYPYSNQRLAEILSASLELIERSIAKFVETGKIEILPNGIIRIVTWEGYQLSDRWIRKLTSAKPEHTSEKAEQGSKSAVPIIDIDKDIEKEKDIGGDFKKSPLYPLAQRILENAKKNNPNLDKGAGYDENKKLASFVKDLSLLKTRTWPHLEEQEVVELANKIFDWVLTYEGSDGFKWSDNIESGEAFRFGCDSNLKKKGKQGGKLISKYYTSQGIYPIRNKGVAPVSKQGTRTFGKEGGGE